MSEENMNEKPPKKILVFIPAYNEEDCIEDAINKVRELYPENPARGFTVSTIVVDDGSTDNMAAIVKRKNVPIISHPRNVGLGAATRSALRAAKEMDVDIAVKLDADLQHAPEDIEKVIQPILDNKADIVYGSRFAGEIRYKMPVVRYIGNKVFTKLMKMLTGWPITDAQTGMMAYGRRYLADFSMPGDYNPPQQTLIDAYHRHLRYAEVPVVFSPRTKGRSFVSLKYPFKVFHQMLRIFVMVNPLKVFIPLSIFLWLVAFTWGGCEFFVYKFYDSSIEFHDTSILLLIIAGIQTFFFGLLADLIVNKK